MFKLFRKRSRAEQNERNYRKWLASYVPTATNAKAELTRTFTDRNENNFYILTNPAHLTRERAQAIEESLKAIEYGISKAEIQDRLEKLQKDVAEMPWNYNKKDDLRKFVESATHDIGDFLYRLKTVKIDDLIIRAGLYFLFVDNENPYIINAETQQKKYDLVQNDEELRAFFLAFMEEVLRGSANTKLETSRT